MSVQTFASPLPSGTTSRFGTSWQHHSASPKVPCKMVFPLICWQPGSANTGFCGTFSGKKRAHKLKKNLWDTGRVSLGHPAGQTGVYRPVSQGLPVICYRKTDRKGQFCRDTGRVSQGHSAIQEVFRKFMYFFLMCLFCSLLLPFLVAVFLGVNSANALLCDTLALSHD